mmetsp:Transcript_4484/g.8664  ORF Transcript_4484/g.8664 Transcript_4484/m.8664 type:complete len:131 (+) Transcript_4484:1405-1797(+)
MVYKIFKSHFSAKKSFLINIVVTQIQNIQKELKMLKDMKIKKSLNLLMGKKLFELGVIEDLTLFENKKIKKKNFSDRTLIKILQKIKPSLSYEEVNKLINAGKIKIKSKGPYNAISLIDKKKEKTLNARI